MKAKQIDVGLRRLASAAAITPLATALAPIALAAAGELFGSCSADSVAGDSSVTAIAAGAEASDRSLIGDTIAGRLLGTAYSCQWPLMQATRKHRRSARMRGR